MGLTAASTGRHAVDNGLTIRREKPDERVIALAGNPNVGKSTVFNALTGLNQHTGNWPGKTVSNAQGRCVHKGKSYVLVDLPGTYSLLAHSAEEIVARDFLCFGGADAVLVVCDATCLERNLNLVLQTLEITPRVVVCVNLMDEAQKKHIAIDLKKLEKTLGVPVVGTSARKEKGIREALDRAAEVMEKAPCVHSVRYPAAVEAAADRLEPLIRKKTKGRIPARWTALQLLDPDDDLLTSLQEYLGFSLTEDQEIGWELKRAREALFREGFTADSLRDALVSGIIKQAEAVCAEAVVFGDAGYSLRDRRIDRLLTSRRTGIPLMLLLLAAILWLTISGANYPSQLLSQGLFWIQDRLTDFFRWAGAPEWLHGMLVLGVYRVLAWVISVMLPPMAIFFPLFTLLEDLGYLPRVAFNLDRYFQKAKACGKQALTMCMGFGCNAAGIVGARIIDSPRERLIAVLTNVFVPCNGRFPTLITLITIFFVGTQTGLLSSLSSALLLTGVILLGIVMTLLISQLLSRTVLKGVPSSFTLELPPYRRPQIGKVIVRSVFDRTLFVLGRAAAVAAPAGLVIWCMANLTVGGDSLLSICSDFLDPFGRLLGMDGVILMAFLLGFPANEIVLPIAMMAYMATGVLTDTGSMTELHSLLAANGWTWLTAANTILFSLMHWPCSTALITVYKETKSVRWTVAAFVLPTAAGMLCCLTLTTVVRLLGLV